MSGLYQLSTKQPILKEIPPFESEYLRQNQQEEMFCNWNVGQRVKKPVSAWDNMKRSNWVRRVEQVPLHFLKNCSNDYIKMEVWVSGLNRES